MTLSLKWKLSEPDNTNALVPHLASYSVANYYVNARLFGMNSNEDKDENSDSSSELDSHANMVFLGQHCYIISSSSRHAEVNAFSREVGRMKSVLIVDVAIVYDFPYSMKTYLLIVRNALYVQSMKNNLIPLFIMREAGLEVIEIPKIHVK